MVRALEYDDTQARGGVHPSEQMLEAFEDRCVHDVKRRIVEYNPPVRRRFLDQSQGPRWFSCNHGSPSARRFQDQIRCLFRARQHSDMA